jgi:hypothetical protein
MSGSGFEATELVLLVAAVGLDCERPSAPIVCESSWPVASMPWLNWNSRSAFCVFGPIFPSTGPELKPRSLSACCAERTIVDEREPSVFVAEATVDGLPLELLPWAFAIVVLLAVELGLALVEAEVVELEPDADVSAAMV